jgi:hypothetical protein
MSEIIDNYKNAVKQYGDIIKCEIFNDGFEIVVRNKTGRVTTYINLYNQYLANYYDMVDYVNEPSYYKAYFKNK